MLCGRWLVSVNDSVASADVRSRLEDVAMLPCRDHGPTGRHGNSTELSLAHRGSWNGASLVPAGVAAAAEGLPLLTVANVKSWGVLRVYRLWRADRNSVLTCHKIEAASRTVVSPPHDRVAIHVCDAHGTMQARSVVGLRLRVGRVMRARVRV
jgi:hypothetical protein